MTYTKNKKDKPRAVLAPQDYAVIRKAGGREEGGGREARGGRMGGEGRTRTEDGGGGRGFGRAGAERGSRSGREGLVGGGGRGAGAEAERGERRSEPSLTRLHDVCTSHTHAAQAAVQSTF